MSLIKSVADSLFSSSELRAYNKKSAIRVILYLLFLGLIFIIPYAVLSVNIGILSYEDKSELRSIFRNDEESIPIEIVDSKLVVYEEGFSYNKSLTSTMSIYIGEEYTGNQNDEQVLTLCFLSDGVYMRTYILQSKLFDYTDYDELKNLNFNGAFTDDMEFWNSIFKVYNDYTSKFRTVYSVIYVISAFIENLFTLVIFSLLVTLFNRLGSRNHLKFGGQWKITIYGMTAYVLGNVFMMLFSWSLVYYIGIIWSLVMCIKATQRYERGDNNEL